MNAPTGRLDSQLTLPQPYLLFLGDTTEAGYAKTAFGLADRGRIAPGLRADMQLVRGDPTRLISDSRNLLKVWRAGIETPIDP